MTTYTVQITVEVTDERGEVIGYEGHTIWDGSDKAEAQKIARQAKTDGYSDAEVREYN